MSDPEKLPPDWKLKLRYGKLTTPFRHFTVLAEGKMVKIENAFGCPLGAAWMGMKTWAADADESANMLRVIGEHIGFEVIGRILIYDETEAFQPPQDKPFGYDIKSLLSKTA